MKGMTRLPANLMYRPDPLARHFLAKAKRLAVLGMLVAMAWMLSTCGINQPAPTVLVDLPSPSQPSPTPQALVKTVIPTTILTSVSPASLTATPDATATATIPPDPLEFIYPTEGYPPVIAWRPPLYPTPWAPTLYDHFFFTSPMAAYENNALVSDYRYGGVFFQDIVHTGVDIPAPKGTPILAAGPGTVTWAGYGVYQGGYDPTDPYGLAVTIQHDFGYQNQALFTVYGHMDEIEVVEGQHVNAGDLLGKVGETGVVTGPHLHFEVRLGENSFFKTRNPELWLVPPIGWGIIAGRVMDTYDQLLYDQPIIITDPQVEKNWFAWSYGKTSVNTDGYYQENLVIGDLPAGSYTLRTDFAGINYRMPIEVQAGVVNYFAFRGYYGFSIEPPPAPGADFTPAPLETANP